MPPPLKNPTTNPLRKKHCLHYVREYIYSTYRMRIVVEENFTIQINCCYILWVIFLVNFKLFQMFKIIIKLCIIE